MPTEALKYDVIQPVLEDVWDQNGEFLLEPLRRDAKRQMQLVGTVVSELEHSVHRPSKIGELYMPAWEAEDGSAMADPYVAIRFTAYLIPKEEG